MEKHEHTTQAQEIVYFRNKKKVRIVCNKFLFIRVYFMLPLIQGIGRIYLIF